MPSVLVTDLKSDVNLQLSQLKLEQDSDKAIQDTIGFCYNMLSKLNDIALIYQKHINKEVQQNDICYQHIKETLDRLGFISKTSIEHCDICKFGKSLMDLYFYKDCGATVNSAIIKKLEEDDCDDLTEYNNEGVAGGEGVVGGVAEFKVDNIFKDTCTLCTDICRYGESWFSIST